MDGARRGADLERSAAVCGHEALFAAARGSSGKAGREGRDSDGGGKARRAADRLLLDGISVHRRHDGRGGGREGDAGDRTFARGKEAAGGRFWLGGGAGGGR